MKNHRKNSAFSLMEIIVVVAMLGILVTLVLGLGRRLKVRSEEGLAQGQIDVIIAALEQYYDFHGKFPFEALPGPPPHYVLADFESDVGGAVAMTSGTYDNEWWSSEALHYFLYRTSDSRRIIDAISAMLITNKDDSGIALRFTINPDPTEIDLIRFIDPWGKSLRYTYTAGDNFPLIESAGVDGWFGDEGQGTDRDNITSR